LRHREKNYPSYGSEIENRLNLFFDMHSGFPVNGDVGNGRYVHVRLHCCKDKTYIHTCTILKYQAWATRRWYIAKGR